MRSTVAKHIEKLVPGEISRRAKKRVWNRLNRIERAKLAAI